MVNHKNLTIKIAEESAGHNTPFTEFLSCFQISRKRLHQAMKKEVQPGQVT
jgi:hypothetical protein